MARASKMGADVATRDANRARPSGHLCAECGKPIAQGELLMVRVVEFTNGKTTRGKTMPYHRNGTCYKA